MDLEVKKRSELTTLVVAPKHDQTVLIDDLECEHVKHDFAREASAVHVVAQKQVLCVLGVAADFKQAHQIEELAVDVTADGDRVLDVGKHIRLRLENRPAHLHKLEGLWGTGS